MAIIGIAIVLLVASVILLQKETVELPTDNYEEGIDCNVDVIEYSP